MCFSELSGELPTFDAPFLVFVFTGYFFCPVRRQSIFASFIVSFSWFGLFHQHEVSQNWWWMVAADTQTQKKHLDAAILLIT